MYITLRLELQYQGDKARKMNHDRDPGHRVLPWSPYDPTRNKLPEGAFSWRKMLDNDLKILEFGHPETVNYVKQSAKIFCNYSVEENGPVHRSLCARVVQLEKPSMRGFKEQICLKYVKIMSSRYERRREREPEPDERTQRSISPGPPRKRLRPDTDPSSSRVVYQRPRTPSPKPHPSNTRYPPAASYHKPPQTSAPTVRPHQDDRRENSQSLPQTPQGSFSAQHSAPVPSDPKDSPDRSSKSNAPSKISNAFATLSSSTALSSILSRTDGAEPPQRTPNSISRSPVQAPTQASGTGMSAAQFDLAKLQSLSQALQGHGPISVASTNGNDDSHNFNPAVAHVEPRSTHPIAAERSSSSLTEKASEPYREYIRPNVQNEGGSYERRASTSSRTSERPLYGGGYRNDSIGSHPDRPHSGDRDITHIPRRHSGSPVMTPRVPMHVRAYSPVRHPRDARSGDPQALQNDERERGRAWERDREREREREWLQELEKERAQDLEREWDRERLERERGVERELEREREKERGRQVTKDLNGVHPSRKALIDNTRHREIWPPTSSKTDDDMAKSLQEELAAAKLALAQAKEDLEAEKRFSANEKQVAATYAQKYLLLRERSQLTKDTLAKVQTDLKTEKRKNEELEQVISDLRREMMGPKMAPEVLDALIKIGGMTIRVKDAFDREGAMT